ncbi:hypothetical protein RND81_02G089600 [Saponaria officinalis]|uniref:Uncharacterized protein n=1 Tax=Saponaria officinalis TaxID=3572 RepID=A0AAW1MSG5_SAPOF
MISLGERKIDPIFKNDAKRLIGRKFSDKTVQSDLKLWPFKVLSCPTKDDMPMIVVTYKDQTKHFSAEEISAMVLLKMKQTAESYLGYEVKDAVVTVPAYFSDSQRQATKNAGIIAGLNVMRIINEPTAAAIAYCLGKKAAGFDLVKRNVLVFDIGGGTFDVSLVSVDKNSFEVKAVSGDTHLGGGDFDNRLVNHFVSEFKSEHNKDIRDNPRSLGKLRVACERAKRVLSASTETSVVLDCLYDGIDFSSDISRGRFERLNMDLFKDCLKPVECCLRDAKMEKGDVDEIVLVGGSTRIPKVQQLLQDFFNGKELCKKLNPDEAVADGAAIYAAILSGVCHKQQVMIVDVTPLSLGIELHDGKLSVVIPRNTPIPVKRERNFTTIYDNLHAVPIPVYEGERSIAKENNLLRWFGIRGIALAPKSVLKIVICFEIDADGILTVTAHENRSGSRSQITITKHSGTHLKGEINRLVEESKTYVADDKEGEKVKTAKANLENYVNHVWGVLSDVCGAVVDKKEADDAVEQAIKWLEWNRDLTDIIKYEEKLQELKSICSPVLSKIHQKQ